MPKLIKEDRLIVYQRALEMLFEEINANCWNTSICPNLSIICRRKFHTEISIKEDLPEFYAQKPQNKPLYELWWPMDDEGDKLRKQALENAIKLVSSK